VSALAVLIAPAPAFVVVLAMSVWHFGSGDVEVSDELSARTRRTGWRRTVHVAAAGAVPVLLPLTAATSSATLVALEPRLAAVTDPGLLAVVRVAVLLLAAVAALVLAADRRPTAAAEISLLVLLALTVPPLLAFAVYFGGWHAVRHTLRLALDDGGRFDPARLRIVVRGGAPSLAVTVIVLAAAVLSGTASPPTVLWFALAAVWGLTVPHMVVVASFDRRRRRGRQSSVGISDRSPETASTSVS
jgi:Brp/Blh family beta-carotene 15,15'-monooxygenase